MSKASYFVGLRFFTTLTEALGLGDGVGGLHRPYPDNADTHARGRCEAAASLTYTRRLFVGCKGARVGSKFPLHAPFWHTLASHHCRPVPHHPELEQQ